MRLCGSPHWGEDGKDGGGDEVNQQILAYLPVLSPIVTLIVVYIGVLAQNRHADVRISDLQRYMDRRFTDTVARLEALIRAETGDLRTRIERLESEQRVIR